MPIRHARFFARTVLVEGANVDAAYRNLERLGVLLSVLLRLKVELKLKLLQVHVSLSL